MWLPVQASRFDRDYGSRYETESLILSEFLAHLKHHLHPEADAQKWSLRS